MNTEPGTKPDTTRGTHLRVDCTADADGRIVFALPPTAADGACSARLLLCPEKGQPEETVHLLDLEPAADGRLLAVLERQPALTEGRWDVCLLPEPDAPRRRLRPGLRDLRALVDGHTRDRSSPVAVRVPYGTKDGYLAVRAWLRTAHAEVEGIDVTDRSMTVRARLHGASLAEGAAVRLRLRGDGTVRVVELRGGGDGRAFSFVVDYANLVGDGGTRDRIWDLSVQASSDEGAAPIRIGRLLDDVADRKEVFVYPTAVVAGGVARPYFTLDNDLSVEVK